jgi:hypothetical protein
MRRSSIFVAVILTGALSLALPAEGKKKKSAQTQPSTRMGEVKTPEEIAAQDAASLDRRATAIVSALDIDNPDKAARVHDTIVAQYRAIREWHAANDSVRKAGTTRPAESEEGKEAEASYQALHDHFIAALAADLTPEQIDIVKDKLTVNKVEVTYKAYQEIVPNLTAEDNAKIMELLKDARDEAIDERSMADKSADFKVYKNKIKAYLDEHGHDVNKAYHDWGQAQKAKKAAKAAQPTTQEAE